MKKVKIPVAIVAITAAMLGAQSASALPTFARQTGISCGGCHNGNFLALTPFGRQFKLKGYTLSIEKTVSKKATAGSRSQLSLPELPGISAMIQISMLHNKVGQNGVQNNTINFPEQWSLFLAGRLSNKVGMFGQFTMSSAGGFGMDNTDIRYADTTTFSGNTLNYGFTLDNNPTVGDLWNSTFAWGFPYAGGDAGGADSPFIGSLGGAVAGVGAYGMLNNQFYGKFSLYRSETGYSSTNSNSNSIVNGAPYWRLAWQKNIGGAYLMLGTYGMAAKVIIAPTNVATGIAGPESKYLDAGVDFQYEKPLMGENSLLVHGSFTNEKRTDVDGSGAYAASTSTTYKYTKLDMQLNLAGQFRPGVVFFNTNTGTDKADNTGYQLDMSYFPWENVQLKAMYSGYSKFGGTTKNASDNNTAYLLLWLMM